ncbi:MAG: hypothetical protein F4Z71_10810 [Gammaproteobacteria bacterium]|nr:hypothetical protein [Gammaproteobacteria bacterium]
MEYDFQRESLINDKEYGVVSDPVICSVSTEVDLFTEEEKHDITCLMREGLLENDSVHFSANIGETEEESVLIFLIGNSSNLTSSNSDVFIRIDQNAPEIIEGTYISEGFSSCCSSNVIKDFLAKVKDGQQRLIIRISNGVFEVTEAMPLNSQGRVRSQGKTLSSNGRTIRVNSVTSAAIEDFLNRTEYLPAFRIQD